MMKDKIEIAEDAQKISSEDINEIISKLKRYRFVHSIILFGSKARGTEKEKSDIDICIIPKPDAEIQKNPPSAAPHRGRNPSARLIN